MNGLFVREDVAGYVLPSAIEVAKQKSKFRQFSATVFCLFATMFRKRRNLHVASAVVVDYKIRPTLGQKLIELFPFSEKYGGLPENLAKLPVLGSISNSQEVSFKIGREPVLSRTQQFKLLIYVIGYLAINTRRGKLSEALSFVFEYYKSLWLLEYTRSNNPPLTFFFTPSSLSSRPSWSYIATEKSSTVFCFYSSNLATFVNDTFSIPKVWHTNVWENVVFPDRVTKDALVALGWGERFQCTAGLLFEKDAEKNSGAYPSQNLIEPSVLFFDVEPFPDTYYENGTFDFQFYQEKYMTQLLESICRTASEKNWHVYLKSKRKRKSETQSEKYTSCLQKWVNNGCLTILTQDTSTQYLADNVNCCVATPFTSAAIISSDLGCPSVYYTTQEVNNFFGGLYNHRDLELVIGEAALDKFLSLNE